MQKCSFPKFAGQAGCPLWGEKFVAMMHSRVVQLKDQWPCFEVI